MKTDSYLDRLIGEKLNEKEEAEKNARTPSGKLSAGKLSWPLQWQYLVAKFKLTSSIDDYTRRKFQRGHDVEDWFIKQINPVDTQKFLEYRGTIGYCDSIVDTKDWDNPVGVIPLECKSVTNMKYKRIEKIGQADPAHILQNSLYALALNSEHHAITYIASDDYRIFTTIHKTEDSKEELDKIISEFEEAMTKDVIPLFVPRYVWQENLKYNNFPEFAGLDVEELKIKFNQLKQ